VSEPLSIYRSRPGLIALLTVLSLVTMLAGSMAIGRMAPGETVWFTAGLACGVTAVVAAILVLRVSGRRLTTFDEGFTIKTPRSSVTARWENIDEFFAPPAAITGTIMRRMAGRYEYRLVIGASTIDLGLPVGADGDLGALIDEQTRPMLHRKWATRLASGRSVLAGPIALSAAGIRIGSVRKTDIPFADISSVDLRGGNLEIQCRSRRSSRRIPIHRIPNVRTVVELIDQRDEWMPARAQEPPRRTRSWG